MKKILLLSITVFLLFFSCANDEFESEVDIAYEGVTFQDVVLSNGIPVEGAIVSIYGNDIRFFDVTDAEGKYRIEVPSEDLIATGFMSLNLYHPEYEPQTVTYEAPLAEYSVHGTNDVSSEMEKCDNCLEVFNARHSELIHLGDNNFSGSINSQFQKASDGIEYSFDIANSNNTNTKLKIGFDAKGLQPNEERVSARVIFGQQTIELEMSPTDGSYAEYELEFENELGVETIKFITSDPRPSDGDVDDWEFTGFYVKGLE